VLIAVEWGSDRMQEAIGAQVSKLLTTRGRAAIQRHSWATMDRYEVGEFGIFREKYRTYRPRAPYHGNLITT
jgi:hypothetical protein